jgi:hypothetical protein
MEASLLRTLMGTLLAGAVFLALVASASAGKPAAGPSRAAQAVIDNCNRHGDGVEITKRFPLSALRAAKREMPGDMRMYTHCVEAIRTAITALAGPAHAGNAKQINRDCANDGTLKYLYPLAALRAAWHNMTDEMVMYTYCRGIVGTEIHMITGR